MPFDYLLHDTRLEGRELSTTVNFLEILLSLLGEFSEVHGAPNSIIAVAILTFITNSPAFARRV